MALKKHLLLYFIIVLIFCISPLTTLTAEELEFDGVIEPSMIVDVGSPVEGVVESITTERSSLVKKGQPLILLDSTVEKAAFDHACTIANLQSEIQLQSEKLAFADRVRKRIAGLFKSKAISTSKNDEAETEVAFARINLQKARENQTIALKELNRAKAVLNLRTILSPISGVVVERFISAGELVTDQPLLKLAQIDPLRVEVILPASMFGTIETGMDAEVIPEIHKDSPYKAIVNLVDRVIDSASGTFGVSLKLPNPDYQLPSGLKCTVHFLPVKKTPINNEVALTSGHNL